MAIQSSCLEYLQSSCLEYLQTSCLEYLQTSCLEDIEKLLYNISNNSLIFHKMIEYISPKIDTCINKLITYLRVSIKIQSKLELNFQKKGSIFMEFKEYCNEALDDIVSIHGTLVESTRIIDNTISSFEKIPSHFTSITIFDNLYDIVQYPTIYTSWIKITNNTTLLHIPSICKMIHYYIQELRSIICINKKTFNQEYKELKFQDTEYEQEIICNLQRYSQYLSEIRVICKNFAIISTVRYRDIKNNTYCYNIGNYIKITSELTRIKNKLDNDITYVSLEEDIKELNNTLSFFREVNYNKHKQQIIAQTIESTSINTTMILQKLSELTYKYKKKNKQYIKVMSDYENFIRIMFHGKF